MTADQTDQKTDAGNPAAKKQPVPATKTAAKPARRKKRGGKVRTKPAGGKAAGDAASKAGLIRKVAVIIKAKGEKPRPSDIVRILGAEGVTVSAAQVSQTLKAAGYAPLRKRRQRNKAKKTAAAAAAKGGGGTGRAAEISLDDLLAAKSVSGAFGGTDKAIAALEALKRLER